MTILLSEIYDVTLKRNIRGACKNGFIRPTIGENFMTHKDFKEISSNLINGTNPMYSDVSNATSGGLTLNIYALLRESNVITSLTSSVYQVPKGYEFKQVDWTQYLDKRNTNSVVIGQQIIAKDSVTHQSIILSNPITEPSYWEFNMRGIEVGIGVATDDADITWPYDTLRGWVYRVPQGFIHNNITIDMVSTEMNSMDYNIGMAVDPVQGYIWWRLDGIWFSSTNGTPVFEY